MTLHMPYIIAQIFIRFSGHLDCVSVNPDQRIKK
jgi:hypothetical protein